MFFEFAPLLLVSYYWKAGESEENLDHTNILSDLYENRDHRLRGYVSLLHCVCTRILYSSCQGRSYRVSHFKSIDMAMKALPIHALYCVQTLLVLQTEKDTPNGRANSHDRIGHPTPCLPAPVGPPVGLALR